MSSSFLSFSMKQADNPGTGYEQMLTGKENKNTNNTQ